ncbi:hypothetical protein BD779DRAFT_1406222, partial [Infundibulicybe gibba]
QALAVADKTTFRNCLVAMCPEATKADVPSAHDVKIYINNSFVQHLINLKTVIKVRVPYQIQAHNRRELL